MSEQRSSSPVIKASSEHLVNQEQSRKSFIWKRFAHENSVSVEISNKLSIRGENMDEPWNIEIFISMKIKSEFSNSKLFFL